VDGARSVEFEPPTIISAQRYNHYNPQNRQYISWTAS
jgi:hypothetical protein